MTLTRTMLAADFITKWRAADLTERAAAQSHFRDVCDLLGEQAPSDADPKGEWYAFEKGATKTTGGEGWADVWKRGCFGWEYKSKGKDLRAAFAQLQRYAPALEIRRCWLSATSRGSRSTPIGRTRSPTPMRSGSTSLPTPESCAGSNGPSPIRSS